MGAVDTASSIGDTASRKPRPRGGFRYASGGGICAVQSSASSAPPRGASEDGSFDANGSADAQRVTEELEALVGGGEGVGAIGEVSYGLEEDRPDEPAPPVSCSNNTPVEPRRVLNYVKSSVVMYLEWW